ncbi:MAG: polysaccharide biosynthesis protein [Nitrospirota bacterium]
MGKTFTRIYRDVKKAIIQHRRLFIVLVLLLQAIVANYLAFIIRFESKLSPFYLNQFLTYLPLLVFIRFVFIMQSGLHKGLWRYASVSDLMKIIHSTTIGSILFLLIVRFVIGEEDYPRSIFFLDWIIFISISGGNRLFIRVFREYMTHNPSKKKILFVGAGDAAEMLVREMMYKRDSSYSPIGFIDNDIQKRGSTIHGIPILGTYSMLDEIIQQHKPDEVLITEADTQKTIREIYEICKPHNITIKKLPGINDILGGNISVSTKIGQILVKANLVTEQQVQEALSLQKNEGGRLGAKLVKLGYITEEKLVSLLNKHYGISHITPISLEDLLQREPVDTNITSLREFIHGKRVLVTGAGGSIGSELSRQILRYCPSHLILMDRYENSLFDIDLELRTRENGSTISTIIADIQDVMSLERIFAKNTPHIVFHAAAYKHVPLMEYNPIEAVKNNIFGTKNLLESAAKYRAENFVLISTDKAVNPTNIMGATKRVAEFLTVNMDALSETKFTTVRFGNVLGTNGSVVPIFKEQLKKGGPLTVTHPDAERFFMLIPEAVHLVLMAAASGKGGEIFVLDMGERVRIIDMAENFIRLSGFIPYREIQIDFIGLRPGEKLHEELFDISEKAITTSHKKLLMAVPEVPSMASLKQHMMNLERCIQCYSVSDALQVIQHIVPNYIRQDNAGTPAPQFMGVHTEI